MNLDLVCTLQLEGPQNEKVHYSRICCFCAPCWYYHLYGYMELTMEDEEYPGQKEFEQYCRETKIPWGFFLIMGVVVLTQIIYWMEYYFARIQ